MGSRVSRDPDAAGAPCRLAVVDLGSNTFRLVVFHYRPGGAFRLADEIRESVRLTAGVQAGRLADGAIGRAWRTARLFAGYCRAAGIEDIAAVATAAVRDAGNRGEAIAALSGPEGLPVRVLSGDDEARYGYLGAVNSTTLTDGLVVELGGGSVQLARVSDRRLGPIACEPLGAVRMTEAFLPTPRSTRPQLKALRRHVQQVLAPHDWLEETGGRLVGMGGTVRTLAAMAEKAEGHPIDEVHGYMLTRDALGAIVDRVAALPVAERDRIPGLKTDRADIILAGARVWLSVMECTGVDAIEVCAQGMRWGVFYERLRAPADPPLFDDVRRTSVLNVARIYDYDRAHCEQVSRLALELFDGLAGLGLHPGDPLEREWLWAASILHDVGVLVDYNDHHKHSFYLVLNAGLPGFTHRELAIIALLVRGHRKTIQGPGSLAAVLEPGDEDRLLRIATVLRMAEQLERGRAGAVRSLGVSERSGSVVMSVRTEGDPGVAIWSAEQERATFARAFGRQLEVGPAG